jgi:DNA-binding MarR family transcriptional regulator
MILKTKHIGKHISLLYRQSQIYFNAELKKYHLGSGQYIFLLSLLENEGINQEQLADIVQIDKTTTARAVAKLEREGYLTRETCPEDKRAYILHATEKAREIHGVLEDILDQWNERMFSDFEEKDKKILKGLLDRAIDNILSSH